MEIEQMSFPFRSTTGATSGRAHVPSPVVTEIAHPYRSTSSREPPCIYREDCASPQWWTETIAASLFFYHSILPAFTGTSRDTDFVPTAQPKLH